MDISCDLACFSQSHEWHMRYHEIQQICIWPVGRRKSEVRTCQNQVSSEVVLPQWIRLWMSIHLNVRSQLSVRSLSSLTADATLMNSSIPNIDGSPHEWVPNLRQFVSQMRWIDVTHSKNGLDKLDDDYWWLISWILNPCDFCEPEIEAEFLSQN